MRTYYNEWDTHAAQWLTNLCKAGLLPPGHVDTQDIRTITPPALKGVLHAHFFAGIGGWPYAMQLAGWPTTRPLWTASCPCQPFSAAGQRRGQADDRHLWPALFRLIRECRPRTIIGEQVASAIGHGWLDGISTDLEAEGYAVGAVVLGAHSVGAPHIRQRLYWVALASRVGTRGNPGAAPSQEACAGSERGVNGEQCCHGAITPRTTGGLAHAQMPERGRAGDAPDARRRAQEAGGPGISDGLDEPQAERRQDRTPLLRAHDWQEPYDGCESNAWSDLTLLPCRDGKTRRTESGLCPLVDGVPFRLADGRTREGVSRTAVLKGIGNAIVPQVAAMFLQTILELGA